MPTRQAAHSAGKTAETNIELTGQWTSGGCAAKLPGRGNWRRDWPWGKRHAYYQEQTGLVVHTIYGVSRTISPLPLKTPALFVGARPCSSCLRSASELDGCLRPVRAFPFDDFPFSPGLIHDSKSLEVFAAVSFPDLCIESIPDAAQVQVKTAAPTRAFVPNRRLEPAKTALGTQTTEPSGFEFRINLDLDRAHRLAQCSHPSTWEEPSCCGICTLF